MAQNKTLTILINEDGTAEINQSGWKGKTCKGAADEIIKLLGHEKRVDKNPDYYKPQDVEVHQHR